MLRCLSQQAADGILHTTNIATCFNNLGLHSQVRRLHLVDGSAVGLAVFPKRLLGFQRGIPEAVGSRQNLQLTVEDLQHEVLLCYGGDEVGSYGFLSDLGLQEYSFRLALLARDGAECIDVHAELQW